MTKTANSIGPATLIRANSSANMLSASGFSERRLLEASGQLIPGLDDDQTQSTEVRLGTARVDDWLGQTEPTVWYRYADSMGRDAAFAQFPRLLFDRLFTRYYGGGDDIPALPSTPTAAQQHFAHRLGAAVGRALSAAWPEVRLPTLNLASTAFAATELEPASADTALHTIELKLALGKAGPAALKLAISTDVLLPLCGAAAPKHGTQFAPAENWQARLSALAGHVPLTVCSVLAHPEIAASRLLQLKSGDLLPFAMPKSVPVTIGGLHFADGSLGEAQGSVAIRIESLGKGRPG